MADNNFSSTKPFGQKYDTRTIDPNIDPANRENPLIGLEGALAWQYAWTSAISMAWSDDTLKRELLSDPRTFFMRYTNYELPSGLNLTVRETDPVDGEGNATGWNPESGIWYLRKSELTMFIPLRPPLEQQAVALAAYVATAKAYPFTGC